jgi:hypothetical protein
MAATKPTDATSADLEQPTNPCLHCSLLGQFPLDDGFVKIERRTSLFEIFSAGKIKNNYMQM